MNESLDTRNEIMGALVTKGGHGIVTRLAEQNGVTHTCIALTIHGKRKNPERIKIIANYLGCTVYGVEPDKKKEINN